MKINVNIPDAYVAAIDGARHEYQTRSSYIREIIRAHVARLPAVAPVPAVDTRTELEKMPPEARAQFERTIAARKAERAVAEVQRTEAQRTMTIDDLSPEKQDAVRRAVAAEVARIGGMITDAHEVPEAREFSESVESRESRESRESSEDDNGYLVGG